MHGSTKEKWLTGIAGWWCNWNVTNWRHGNYDVASDLRFALISSSVRQVILAVSLSL